MATTAIPRPSPVSNTGIDDILNIFKTVAPVFGKGSSTSTTTVDKSGVNAAGGQVDDLLKSILGGNDPKNFEDLISNIMERAKQTFAPVIGQSISAGNRAYSDTTLKQLAGEAMARATGEAASAKLAAISANNQMATNLVGNKLNAAVNTADRTTVGRTAADPAAKAVSVLGTGLAGYSIYDKIKKKLETVKTDIPEDFNFSSAQVGSPGVDSIFTSGTEKVGAVSPDIFTQQSLLPQNEISRLFESTPAFDLSAASTPNTLTTGVVNADALAAANLISATELTSGAKVLLSNSTPETVMSNMAFEDEELGKMILANRASETMTDVGFDFGSTAGGEVATDVAGDALVEGAEDVIIDTGADAAMGFPYLTAARVAGETLGINEITGPLNSLNAGINEVLSSAVSGVEDIAEDVSVICTEAARQGFLNKKLFREEAKINHTRISKTTLLGYHFLAIPVVLKMRKDKAFAKKMAKFATEYCNAIVYGKYTWRSTLLRFIGEPLCYLLGLFVRSPNWKQLYNEA